MVSNHSKYSLYFTHGNGEEIKEEIKNEVSKVTSALIEDWGWISPVACVHCGPGFVGMLIQEE